MVVGEDRAGQVFARSRGLQVVGCRADRIYRVVGVLPPVVVGVYPVGVPGGRHELHPPLGARGRDVQVRAECRFDPVDGGEHVPRNAVLGAARLVDRQEERRDREAVDDEVGDADGGRPKGRNAQGGVLPRRNAVRTAHLVSHLVLFVAGLLCRLFLVVLGLALAAAALASTHIRVVRVLVVAVAVVIPVVVGGRGLG